MNYDPRYNTERFVLLFRHNGAVYQIVATCNLDPRLRDKFAVLTFGDLNRVVARPGQEPQLLAANLSYDEEQTLMEEEIEQIHELCIEFLVKKGYASYV